MCMSNSPPQRTSASTVGVAAAGGCLTSSGGGEGPGTKGHTPPHFDNVAEWLEALVAATLHQQRHGEVARLEPLTHLHGGEGT